MPSLFRFLILLSLIGGTVLGGLYALAMLYEPQPTEVTKTVHGVAIRRQ